MEDANDTYYDAENGVIVLHEVLKCRNCGEIILTSEQMHKFVTKLKIRYLEKRKEDKSTRLSCATNADDYRLNYSVDYNMKTPNSAHSTKIWATLYHL